MTESRNPAANAGRATNGQFTNGNQGKPKGTRSRAALLTEKLMEDETGAVVRAVVAAAKDGDMTAARLVLERIAPPRKGRPVLFDLPPIETAADLPTAMGALVRAVTEGALSPDEAGAVAVLLEAQRKSLETADIERRLTALEQLKEPTL